METQKISNSSGIDVGRQRKAKRYAHINRRLLVLDIIITGLYLVAWLIFGWSQELKNWLLQFTMNDLLLIALYIIVFGGILFLIGLPLTFYQGYVIPHRFDLSTQTLTGWIKDQLKGI